MKIKKDGTLFVHSSLRAIGPVDNGGEGVLDALMEYMNEGLLVLPAHTWEFINDSNNVFDPWNDMTCVGTLPNLFLRRANTFRSLHPTHSVAAYGREAEAYVSGEEYATTPCSRTGCYGKLYDRRAKILFLGCSLKTNTFLHAVEEWNNVPYRITREPKNFYIKMKDGRLLPMSVRCHDDSVYPHVSETYDKMEPPFLHLGIAKKGRIGKAKSFLCDAVGMADLVSRYLSIKPHLFGDDEPVPTHWYIK